ncbi:MAG: hypothetical protein OEQ29_02360 [Alphaproteobacteria bacterium]|nr:hypothetical protein [Alphaproteobacteria bacterium]
MKKWILAIVAAVVLSTSPSMATVGMTYLTAYDKAKGSQAKAAKFGKQIRLKLPSEVSKSKARSKTTKSTKASKTAKKSKMPPNSYTEQVRYCGKQYYTTKWGKRWIAAHTKARHVLLVRYHQAKGKYKIVCGTKPKGPARKPIRKNAKPKKPTGKSS